MQKSVLSLSSVLIGACLAAASAVAEPMNRAELATIVGGWCGLGPEDISALSDALSLKTA